MFSVVLAGGGTAGHTSPLIATAQALQAAAPSVRLLCVGTARGLETRVIPEAGLELSLIPPVPLPRRIGLDLLRVPWRLGRAVSQAGRILAAANADVVAGFGGYVALPVYLAARLRGIPVVLHEQNAVPGLANKVAARFAAVVAVTFPRTPLRGAVFVGMPLRAAIVALDRGASRVPARKELGLRHDLPVLLVSGGSQGARSINAATRGAVEEFLAAGVQVLHVLGPNNAGNEVSVKDPVTGAGYFPVTYVDRMELAYAAADLMVGRSGAGTVIETATVGLPTVLVPLPHGNGEQARNAEPLVDAGAAALVPDSELTPARLLAETLPLLAKPQLLAKRGAAARATFPADAAATLAGLILRAGRHAA